MIACDVAYVVSTSFVINMCVHIYYIRYIYNTYYDYQSLRTNDISLIEAFFARFQLTRCMQHLYIYAVLPLIF